MGLEDGIQVGVAPGFETTLGAQTPSEVQLIRDIVLAAFGVWENPALQFDITFDAPVGGLTTTGLELDLHVVGQTHAAFRQRPNFFGFVFINQPQGSRTLTNGMVTTGINIIAADIFLNIDLINGVAPLLTRQEQLDSLGRLLMHEIGHSIGLGHPDAAMNFDTDLDPLNQMSIDPADPFTALLLSPNIDSQAIMTPRPCGAAVLICPATFFTQLRADDIAGRDALYLSRRLAQAWTPPVVPQELQRSFVRRIGPGEVLVDVDGHRHLTRPDGALAAPLRAGPSAPEPVEATQ